MTCLLFLRDELVIWMRVGPTLGAEQLTVYSQVPPGYSLDGYDVRDAFALKQPEMIGGSIQVHLERVSMRE